MILPCCLARRDSRTRHLARKRHGKNEAEDRWNAIRGLWDWRLDQIDDAAKTARQDHADELRQFLDCVRESSVTDMAGEPERVQCSLSHMISENLQ